MRRIKVCHILYGLGIGGIETLAVKLFNRMDRTRFEHVVISIIPERTLEPEVEPGAARFYWLDKKPGVDPRIYAQVLKILLLERPDVVHTRNWSTLLEGVLPSLLARVPGRVHSFDGLNADNLGEEPWMRVQAQRLLMPKIEQVVARSPAMRDAMSTQLGIPIQRIGLIADGIELQRYDAPVDVKALQARFGLTPDEKVLGIVARLDPVKDHRTLFRAMTRLLPAHPQLKALVVGGGPLEAELRSEVASSSLAPHICFTGPQLDVPSLYSLMTVYVQPSLYEGVSGSILEAMASRLPVVSTQVGGTVDIVAEGVSGLLVAPGDDEALADRLHRLLSAPEQAQRLGQAGRAFVEAHFSLEQVLTKYSQVYRAACGVSTPAGEDS